MFLFGETDINAAQPELDPINSIKTVDVRPSFPLATTLEFVILLCALDKVRQPNLSVSLRNSRKADGCKWCFHRRCEADGLRVFRWFLVPAHVSTENTARYLVLSFQDMSCCEGINSTSAAGRCSIVASFVCFETSFRVGFFRAGSLSDTMSSHPYVYTCCDGCTRYCYEYSYVLLRDRRKSTVLHV